MPPRSNTWRPAFAGEIRGTELPWESLYHRVEQAILFDYFGIPRPKALRDIDIKSHGAVDSGPVRVEPSMDDDWTEISLPNAVARIVLSGAQERLPQWMALSSSGDVRLGRNGWNRAPLTVALMPQALFSINWADSGPGFSWPEAYHAIALLGFSRTVVTASADSPDAHGYTDFAIGWFHNSEDWRIGCKRVITAWWRSARFPATLGLLVRIGCDNRD